MMKTPLLILVSTLLAAASAHAQERHLRAIPFSKFNELTSADKIDNQTVYYTEKIQSFEDWQKLSKDEVEFLNLYPGYVEPEVKIIRNGLDAVQTEKITVFATRAKTILSKPASQIDLKTLLQKETLAKLTPQMQHQVVAPNQIMPLVAGSDKIENFSFCNQDGAYILRPAREKDLKSAVRSDRAWCENTDRSVCVQSCFKFGILHQGLVSVANSRRDTDRKIDHGVALESEMRYYVSEAEMGRKGSLKKLTGLDTPVRGVFEQSMFYWNQIMQFGKVLAVFQEHPTDSSKTVVTSLFVIGIKTRTYKENVVISELIRGRAKGINEDTGIMAGVPTFTQEIAMRISEVFEK